jgi:hypothetical protein
MDQGQTFNQVATAYERDCTMTWQEKSMIAEADRCFLDRRRQETI